MSNEIVHFGRESTIILYLILPQSYIHIILVQQTSILRKASLQPSSKILETWLENTRLELDMLEICIVIVHPEKNFLLKGKVMAQSDAHTSCFAWNFDISRSQGSKMRFNYSDSALLDLAES